MNVIAITWHPKLGHRFVLPLIISMTFKIRSLNSYLIKVAIKILIRIVNNYDKYLWQKRKNVVKKKS